MKISGLAALVTGAGSGLGAETARELARHGAKVAVLDINESAAKAVAAEIGGLALRCDITDSASVNAALDAAREAHGPARMLMNVAGIGGARRLVGKDGTPMPIEDFQRIVNVNLVGTFNVIRLVAARMLKLDPMDDGERGVIVNTASVAAYDGQVGQEAYAASKGGIVSLTLPLARDLAQFGVRVCTIAPGLFLTPLLHELLAPGGAAVAGGLHPLPEAPGQARGVCPARRAHRHQRLAQRRGHPSGRRPAPATALKRPSIS
jgi:NAD(P)-dependent dehydrogenase (short-subunit alcohol dehydrogenase family)